MDYERATTEQLIERYNLCNSILTKKKKEKKIQNFFNKIFIVYVILVLIFEYLVFFFAIKNIILASIVSLIFMFLHFYYSGNCLENLEIQLETINNYILELTSEIEQIKELIYVKYKEGQAK